VAQLYPQELGSLFIASYDSQGYGGGLRTCLHVGFGKFSSQSHVANDGQSISKSWRRASSGAHDQILFDSYGLVFLGRPL
jgi:hypothetical protein